MAINGSAAWYHSNRYNAEAACEHCKGIVRHEPWCITMAATVAYAYEIVGDPSKLSIGDTLILHSLGVIWEENSCKRNCVKTLAF
jgi:hypothetical protein